MIIALSTSLVIYPQHTKMLYPSILSLFVSSVTAIYISQQPKAPNYDSQDPLRDLTWGQLNFIHTTDTHGWLPGHLLEPNFSADWGDLISFVAHMRRKADDAGVDILVVDSGDRHDGNGLSDATNPPAIYTESLFTMMDYDIITIGNHELYQWQNSLQEFQTLRPKFGEKYVVSNVDILCNGEWTPMGNKYRRFTTKNQGLRVIGFGFLFDFRGNNPNTRVTRCADAVKESWFTEALAHKDTDVFVIASHIPIRYFPEMNTIISAIREAHPHAVIQFLGGHSHIRDFTVVDQRATALESGRFLETIGWVSVDNIDREDPHSSVEFTRSYIDFNLHSLTHHSNTTVKADSTLDEFNTDKGLSVSRSIETFRKSLDLDHRYGCVPHSYFMDRARYPGPNSLYSLLTKSVLTRLVGTELKSPRPAEHPRYVIINTGSIRFDLFSGPFTRDTAFIISPFVNNWRYLPDVPLKYAKNITPELNKYQYILASEASEAAQPTLDVSLLKNPQQRAPSYALNFATEEDEVLTDIQQVLGAGPASGLSSGYRTCDDYGCSGDDTIHKPWTFFPMPNAVQSEENIPSDDEALVDVVFYDFLYNYIMDVLPKIGYDNYTVLPYGGNGTVQLLTDYVTEVWSSCE